MIFNTATRSTRPVMVSALLLCAGPGLLGCVRGPAGLSAAGSEAHFGTEHAPAAEGGAVHAEGTDYILGYTDTPLQPDGKWRIHDPERPPPATVRTEGGVFTSPPSDALVLFDGTDLSAWRHIRPDVPEWTVEADGALRVAPYLDDGKATDIETHQSFGDIQLHIEWRSPPEIEGGSQGRGNSGVFLMGRYEVQILDSFENPTYADGQAAAIYGWAPPLKNASLPPGDWQSYDIVFEAPRFDGEVLLSPAYVTVFHNGVLVHHRQEIPGVPTHRRILPYTRHDSKAPIRLQNHRSPVEFRNIWVREIELTCAGGTESC